MRRGHEVACVVRPGSGLEAAMQAAGVETFALPLVDWFEPWSVTRLRRWLQLVPAYIDWQARRQQTWSFQAAEQQGARELASGQLLRGRLDRIDSGPGGTAIIDYKTGSAPSGKKVAELEEMQVLLYAAALEAATAAGTGAVRTQRGAPWPPGPSVSPRQPV